MRRTSVSPGRLCARRRPTYQGPTARPEKSNSLSLADTWAAENSVGLTAGDHRPTATVRKGLEGDILAHCGEDLLQDFDAESRSLFIAQVLEGRREISDEPQRFRRRRLSAEHPENGNCRAQKAPEPLRSRHIRLHPSSPCAALVLRPTCSRRSSGRRPSGRRRS